MSLRQGRTASDPEEWPRLPEGWQLKRLKWVCDVLPSNVDKKTEEGEQPVLLCNYTDVYYNETIVEGMDFMPASASPAQIAKLTLRAGDTVITKDSETADDIASAAYVPRDLEGVVCGYHLAIVRPRVGAHGPFVKWLFNSTYAKSCFAVRARGLTRVGLARKDLDSVELPVPPLSDQVLIASFLDASTQKIDRLIQEQQRLIGLLAEKRQAVVSNAVTRGLNPDVPLRPSGIEWLGDVPAHWTVTPVKRVLRSIEQGWSPQCEGAPAGPDEWGVLRVGCVNGGVFNAAENKALPPELVPSPDLSIARGDLLISRANTRELVGSAAVAESDYPRLMLCDKLYRLRLQPDLVDARFLSMFLGSAHARGRIELQASGASASMVNIAQGVILELPVPIPPLGEQVAIVSFVKKALSRLEAFALEAKCAINLLQERRSALVSAAVTGQLDVRGLAGVEVA